MAATAACLFSPAVAQTTGDVTFNGTVLDSCLVVIGTPGNLAPNTNNTLLSTDETTGLEAAATITTTSASFDVNVDVPTGFASAPSGGDTAVTYAADYSATGATTATDVNAGTATDLGFGVTALTVGASATKTTGVFPAGIYQMQTTVRCVSP